MARTVHNENIQRKRIEGDTAHYQTMNPIQMKCPASRALKVSPMLVSRREAGYQVQIRVRGRVRVRIRARAGKTQNTSTIRLRFPSFPTLPFLCTAIQVCRNALMHACIQENQVCRWSLAKTKKIPTIGPEKQVEVYMLQVRARVKALFLPGCTLVSYSSY